MSAITMRNVNMYGVKIGQLDMSERRIEGVTIISNDAPLRLRLLGAWTAIFGLGLQRFIARHRRPVYIVTPPRRSEEAR